MTMPEHPGSNEIQRMRHPYGPQDDNNGQENQRATGGNTTDLNRLLNSTACNVSLGVILLLIGIVITSMTFKEYRATNKIFLLGPILVGAGALGIGKAVMKKYHFRERDHRRNRRLNRRIHHQLRASNRSESDSTLRRNSDSFIRDAPPPYDIISILNASRSALLPVQDSVHVPTLPNYSEIDPLPPPPKYEDVIEETHEETDDEMEQNDSEDDNGTHNTEVVHSHNVLSQNNGEFRENVSCENERVLSYDSSRLLETSSNINCISIPENATMPSSNLIQNSNSENNGIYVSNDTVYRQQNHLDYTGEMDPNVNTRDERNQNET